MKSLRVIVPLAIVLAALLVAWLSGSLGRGWRAVREFLVHCLEFINGLDPLIGALSFLGLYVAATVLFVPGLLITMGAGFLFGIVKGTLLVSVSSVVGASLAFLIGRYLARDWVARKLEGRRRFREIDDAVSEEGAKIVFLLRLSPVFPYNLLNYALGLTGISFGRYALASWIGMLPGTLMYVYLGSLAGNLAALAADTGEERSTLQWVLFVVGLLATIAVTVYVTRLARRALNTKLPEPES